MRKFCVLILGLLMSGCHKPAAPLPQQANKITISKSQHSMTLWSGDKILKTYKVALGRGKGEAKSHQGDHETPEGTYVIDSKNSKSRFHLALHVSYPNAEDIKRAKSKGLSPGGDIMIHGVHSGFQWLGGLQHDIDWTDGCIAVTDSEIEEIFAAVPIGTPIQISH